MSEDVEHIQVKGERPKEITTSGGGLNAFSVDDLFFLGGFSRPGPAHLQPPDTEPARSETEEAFENIKDVFEGFKVKSPKHDHPDSKVKTYTVEMTIDTNFDDFIF